jgi:hypothetical protein
MRCRILVGRPFESRSGRYRGNTELRMRGAWAGCLLACATGLQGARLPGSIGCMGLVGYGSYDTESYKPRGTEIFNEYFETLYPEGALEYEESDTTGARAELRVDEEGYWWVRVHEPVRRQSFRSPR